MTSAEIKIVFTGTVGVGKSTAISAISERPPVATDVGTTDEVSEIKEATTVAMDYGEMRLDDGEKLRLYGTPGQERFRFMWEILARGALGFILLVDNTRPDPLADLDIYLDNFGPWIDATAAVIGVTHWEEGDGPGLDEYYGHLGARGAHHPVLFADPRDPPQVVTLVEALLASLEFAAMGDTNGGHA